MNGKEKIKINKDKITYIHNNKEIVVMDRVEEPLMKKFAEVVTQNGGDILEIGFGLGISADYIYNSDINSYTCIEIHPEIYKKALKWAKNKKNVEIILGGWEKIIPNINKKFDGIFLDTYQDFTENYFNFKKYCYNIAKENCILTTFSSTLQVTSDNSYEIEKFHMPKQEYLNMESDSFPVTYSYYNNGHFKRKSKPNLII